MEVWILGATGRAGRAIVSALAGTAVTPVPVGRDTARLAAAFPDVARTVSADSLTAMAAEIHAQRPAVVVNTIGPFGATCDAIARACLPASHYLDLANDMWAFSAVFDLHERAVQAGRALVPGAGFGVLATEGVVTALCAGRPIPERVRVDMVPSLASEDGVIGQALAASIVDGLPDGRRCYVDGHPQRVTPGHDAVTLVLPDGTTVATAWLPLGDLAAARRASGAPMVVAASSLAPTRGAARALVRVVGAMLTLDPARRFARDRLAAVRTRLRERPRPHSYGHARVEWADGTVREGWLRAGDAGEFTASTAAAVAATRNALTLGVIRPGSLDEPIYAERRTVDPHRAGVRRWRGRCSPLTVSIVLAWVAVVVAQFGAGRHLVDHDALLGHGGLPSPGALVMFALAWVVMVTAMMLPSAVPMIRLFTATAAGQPHPQWAGAAIVGGYLAIWTVFGWVSLAFDGLVHHVVDAWPWLDAHHHLVAAGVLALAGAYQLSPLKDACLRTCRYPAAYLLAKYRRGTGAALRIGAGHGLFCLGCCWALMLVAFALGMTQLILMAGFTALMAYEKTGRHGELAAQIAGLGLLIAAVAVATHH